MASFHQLILEEEKQTNKWIVFETQYGFGNCRIMFMHVKKTSGLQRTVLFADYVDNVPSPLQY